MNDYNEYFQETPQIVQNQASPKRRLSLPKIHASRRVIFSILSFIILIGGLVAGIALTKQSQEVRKKATGNSVALALVKSTNTVSPEGRFSVTILANLNNTSYKASAITARVLYPSTKLTLEPIEFIDINNPAFLFAHTFPGQQAEFLNKTDITVPGVATLSVGNPCTTTAPYTCFTPGKSDIAGGIGIVARLNFVVLPGATGVATIQFDPNATKMSGLDPSTNPPSPLCSGTMCTSILDDTSTQISETVNITSTTTPTNTPIPSPTTPVPTATLPPGTTATPTPTTTPCGPLNCDVNRDGTQNTADGTLAQGCYGQTNLTSSCRNADTNCDGTVNIVDIQTFAGSCQNIFPQPTPTPTSTPIPTATPIPTPTPSPTPEPTPTPTLVPNPGKANVALKLKFQGIVSHRASKTIKITLVPKLSDGAGTPEVFNAVPVQSNDQGVYSGLIANVNPGTYDVYIKGWAHLQKKFADQVVNVPDTTLDFLNVFLLAGDVSRVVDSAGAIIGYGDNIINGLDLARIIGNYNPEATVDSIDDINLDGVINGLDLARAIQNYQAEGDSSN